MGGRRGRSGEDRILWSTRKGPAHGVIDKAFYRAADIEGRPISKEEEWSRGTGNY